MCMSDLKQSGGDLFESSNSHYQILKSVHAQANKATFSKNTAGDRATYSHEDKLPTKITLFIPQLKNPQFNEVFLFSYSN